MDIREQFDMVANAVFPKEEEPADEDCVREGERVDEKDGWDWLETDEEKEAFAQEMRKRDLEVEQAIEDSRNN
jgi:hypothetical protein